MVTSYIIYVISSLKYREPMSSREASNRPELSMIASRGRGFVGEIDSEGKRQKKRVVL